MSPTKSVISSALFFGVTLGQQKFMPTDAGWPSTSLWNTLNETVDGRLIKTVPLPSVCHSAPFGNYNAAECSALQAGWTEDIYFIDNPAMVMNPYIQNQSCIPYTPESQPCQMGNMAMYSINVTGVADVVAGINFAQNNNIRLSVKNTGHDFMGKSSGGGSLSLWTHNLNTTTIIPSYTSSYYNGPAAKLGAGVNAGFAYPVVGDAGYRILGGTCATVGLAGGYTSGGGHGFLNGAYGMAADAVLEWEVVTAKGEHLIATPTNNTDLYWALSGGGAGTFAVVLSLTTKIFKDGIVGGGNLTFNSADRDLFWEGIGSLWEFLPGFTEAGPNTMDMAINTAGFSSVGITLPDQDATAVAEIMAPFIQSLENLGIEYTFTTDTSPSYFDHIVALLGPFPWGLYPANIQLTSRLIPRAAVLNKTQNAAIMSAFRNYTEAFDGYWTIGCHAMNVKNAEHPDNAVFPGWRDAVAICNAESIWDWDLTQAELEARKEMLVNTLIPGLEAVTVGGGAYLNEIDAQWKNENWQQELYGANYPRLLDIKNTYDPNHVFYAKTAVGSEYWAEDANGRLTRVL